MGIQEIMSVGWAEITCFESFGGLLREHGVDLSRVHPDHLILERGTPVYAESQADSMMILRRMSLLNVRVLFVLEGDRVVGAIDLTELGNALDEASNLVLSEEDLQPSGTR